MYESILISIKKLLGIAEDYDHFDPDLIMHINTVFMILYQMGVGPKEAPFMIEDANAIWDNFIKDAKDLQPVKTYIALKVKLVFDPPTSSSHLQAINDTIKELEWCLYSAESSDNFDPDKIEEVYSNFPNGINNRTHRRTIIWKEDTE